MNLPGRSLRGFTLIELLIVVAIIAILASIAVVNFMEAQTRAKVSRSKADLKTVVTALEAYRTDNNGYPTYHYSDVPNYLLQFHIGGGVAGPSPAPDPNWNGRNPVTTPIAYISSMPEDPFAARSSGNPELRQFLYTNWRYAWMQVTVPPFHQNFKTGEKLYGAFRLHSKGPDQKGPDSGIPYDATNGTASAGDIIYGQSNGFDKLVDF